MIDVASWFMTLLKPPGGDPIPTPRMLSLEELKDVEDDAARVHQTLLRAHIEALPTRIAHATAADTFEVDVAGERFVIAEALRALADKEDARVYPSLRDAIDRCAPPTRHAFHPFAIAAPNADAQAALTSFLTTTAPLCSAVIEMLSHAGKAEVTDRRSLLRALDLPLRDAPHDDVVRAAAKTVIDALPRQQTPFVVKRTTAPRLWAGHVTSTDAVRLFVPSVQFPTLRMSQHLDVTHGTGALLARGAGGDELRGAFTVALLSSSVRRHTQLPRPIAERAERIGTATLFLRARVAASVALVNAPEQDVDACRELVQKALGFDVGAPDVLRWLAPPLPTGGALVDVVQHRMAAATNAVDAAALWRTARNDADELFLFARGLPERAHAWLQAPRTPASTSTSWAELLSPFL
jgi:hypothetical protein